MVHQRQLDATFPPRRTLEDVWSGRLAASRVPRAVAASAERLRNELHPERGAVDWRPIQQRRNAALVRDYEAEEAAENVAEEVEDVADETDPAEIAEEEAEVSEEVSEGMEEVAEEEAEAAAQEPDPRP